MARVEHFAEKTLNFEGGYQAIASDDGNYCYYWSGGKRIRGALIGTKFGISAQAYQQAYGTCPTVSQMKNLTKSQAKYIFKKVFWDDLVSGDDFRSQWVANMVFQAAIGSTARLTDVRIAINKVLKKNNLPVISTLPIKLSKAEISVINNLDSLTLFNTIFQDYYKKLESINKYTYGGSMKGWFTRLDEIMKMANDEYFFLLHKHGEIALWKW